MFKFYIAISLLININVIVYASSPSIVESDSLTYKVHYKDEDRQDNEFELSQKLVNLSSVLQTAVECMRIHNKSFIDIAMLDIDIDILKLLNYCATNTLSVDDFQVIITQFNMLIRYLDFLLIEKAVFLDLLDADINMINNPELMNSLIKRYLLENHEAYLFENNFMEYAVQEELLDHNKRVTSVAISYNNEYIVSCSRDKTIIIWDMKTGEKINQLRGHEGTANSVAISSDNKYIVSGSSDTTVIIWDMKTGEQLHKLRGHTNSVESVAISSDVKPEGDSSKTGNKYIVSGSWDGAIIIWDMETGEQLNQLIGLKLVGLITISSDNKYIVSGSLGGIIIIWDMKTGKKLNQLIGHERDIRSLVISNDNKYIVSGSDDYTIIIWDMETGEKLNQLRGHNKGAVTSVTISSDNKYIISGSWGKTIIIWNRVTGEKIHQLTGHMNAVYSVVISTDNKYIVSGSDDKMVIIWELKESDILKFKPLSVLKKIYAEA